jgi:drug/metabolite transporter (DMT)-like permease
MFRTGHLYHFITASFFLLLGIYLVFNPDVNGLNARIFGVVLMLWGLFRVINGYFLLKRKKRDSAE